MIASITRLRSLKSYVGWKSHEKSQIVSVNKLHNIVQSIGFYWLNSSLNQLQILNVECFAMHVVEWRKKAIQRTTTIHYSRQKNVVEKKKKKRSVFCLYINKNILVTGSKHCNWKAN